MTWPITVYPTGTPGLWRASDGRPAQHIPVAAHEMLWCFHCTQLLDAPSCDHWDIMGDEWCKHCVEVADHEMV